MKGMHDPGVVDFISRDRKLRTKKQRVETIAGQLLGSLMPDRQTLILATEQELPRVIESVVRLAVEVAVKLVEEVDALEE